jgi:hypothetical protein
VPEWACQTLSAASFAEPEETLAKVEYCDRYEHPGEPADIAGDEVRENEQTASAQHHRYAKPGVVGCHRLRKKNITGLKTKNMTTPNSAARMHDQRARSKSGSD